MDAPRLILIDEMRDAIPAELVERTANAVLSAVRAGAAALWLTRPRASEGAALMADALAYRLDRYGLAPLARAGAR
ncbi:hypothetical protein G5B40_05150 [Pikeienuella piscinae]|uniref:Uncharacterized protein n=1 Tax=Pikeienuella piscinae TaxID=2748098 RepID=A0A7L5BZ58_9RHOB|nr:hypothetical protein [Pikeienuella piscinae]QIE54889.1 hypothetical protein G5B40_05150 [Pikeienuella piscinae]